MKRNEFLNKAGLGLAVAAIAPQIIAQVVVAPVAAIPTPAIPTPAIPMSPMRVFDEAHPLVGKFMVERLDNGGETGRGEGWSQYTMYMVGWCVKSVSCDGYAIVERMCTDKKDMLPDKILAAKLVERWNEPRKALTE